MKMNDHIEHVAILAIDLGKKKSVWCHYRAPSGRRSFGDVATERKAMHDLLVEKQPDRLVIEIGNNAGWLVDLARSLGIVVQVANTNHEAWRWIHVKNKTDHRDALKQAELSAMNQLSTVHMPTREVREWRSLIAYRRTLVKRRTQIKNNIRAVLDRENERIPSGSTAWTKKWVTALEELAGVDDGSYWRLLLRSELRLLQATQNAILAVEDDLQRIASSKESVARLRTAPSVGPRLAEAVVAVIDDPHRFTRGRQVGCYVGLTARRYQSGQTDRQGRISGQGNKCLRSLLVQAAWIGVCRLKVPWMVDLFERVSGGRQQRRKTAIVAVARHLLVRLWAMLRDGTEWRDPVACRLRLAA